MKNIHCAKNIISAEQELENEQLRGREYEKKRSDSSERGCDKVTDRQKDSPSMNLSSSVDLEKKSAFELAVD